MFKILGDRGEPGPRLLRQLIRNKHIKVHLQIPSTATPNTYFLYFTHKEIKKIIFNFVKRSKMALSGGWRADLEKFHKYNGNIGIYRAIRLIQKVFKLTPFR